MTSGVPGRAAHTIVAVQFRAPMTRTQVETAFGPEAPAFTKLPGLRWKFWTFNEETRDFMGVYLFENSGAVKAYLDGPVVPTLRKQFGDVRVETYAVLPELSRTTRAPL